ncbi:MAG TPA: hypothetical protein VMG98_06590 [Verrucomicrobiae bacterium]|nr:hypothetical protein [Verrucomicrobiae bacterium]
MRLRQFPAVAILGLLASLAAHAASYGGDHVAGGAYHGALVLLALVGVGGFVVSVAALAWLGVRRHADGSILAAALRPLVPPVAALAASASLWFGAIESLESPHIWHASLLVIGLFLIAASVLINLASRALVRAIAAIVVAIARPSFARRPVCYRRRFAHRSSARRTYFVYRRFARPPPSSMLLPV